jgi:Tol biopolymer transport system component
MNPSRPLIPIAGALVAVIAAIGYFLATEPSAVQVPATQIAITPRLPGNATTQRTPIPTIAVPDAAPGELLPTMAPPAPDSAEPLPPLIFVREGQIWRSDGTGAPARQLTTLAEGISASHPTITHDGSQIAFVALVPPPITATLPLPISRLYILPSEGGDLREIWAPKTGILWLPSWSSDATALYLFANGTINAADDGGMSRLEIVRIDLTTNEHTTIVTGALDPTVARNGSQIAYLKFDTDGVTMHLEVANLDGSNPRRIIDGRSFQGFYAPRFSPDMQRIYVAAIAGPQTDDQGIPLHSPTSHSPVEWLGSLLTPRTAQAHGAPWDIWSVKLDGTDLRRMTWLNEDLPMLAFSPDGSQVAVMAFNGIYLMNPDGSDIRRIDPYGDHGGLDWLP